MNHTRAIDTTKDEWLVTLPVRRWALAVSFVWMLLLCENPAAADFFKVNLVQKDASGKDLSAPVLTVIVKNKDGKPFALNALWDTGNTDGVLINPEVAKALGFQPTGNKIESKGTGGMAAGMETKFEGNQAITVRRSTVTAGKDNKNDTITFSGQGNILPNQPKEFITLSAAFINQFVYTIDPKDHVMYLTTLAEKDKAPKVGPDEKKMNERNDDEGSINEQGHAGTYSVVDMSLFSPTNTVTPTFVIDPAFSMSLISVSEASQLGINTSGLPQSTIATSFGDIIVPEATIGFRLFPNVPEKFDTFGIVPDSFNPDGINILGSDILNSFGVYQVDTVDDVLRAGQITSPEPSTLTLLGLGSLSLLVYGWRRRQQRAA